MHGPQFNIWNEHETETWILSLVLQYMQMLCLGGAMIVGGQPLDLR